MNFCYEVMLAAHARVQARSRPGQGRQVAYPLLVEKLAISQLARRTPPSACGPNIVQMAKALVPWIKVRAPTPAATTTAIATAIESLPPRALHALMAHPDR